MSHGRVGIILAGLLVGLAACSSPPPPSGPAAPSRAGIGPCGGIDAARAASILKIARDDVVGPQHLSTFSCVYRSRKDFYTSMTFNVYVEPTAARAHRKLQDEKAGLARLSPSVALHHVGDEAWRLPDPRVRRMLMRKGNVWLDVVTPGDEAAQLRMAKIVAANLR